MGNAEMERQIQAALRREAELERQENERRKAENDRLVAERLAREEAERKARE